MALVLAVIGVVGASVATDPRLKEIRENADGREYAQGTGDGKAGIGHVPAPRAARTRTWVAPGHEPADRSL
jgi:hypothetical protein